MAATDKNKKGNRIDCARHYSKINAELPICGNKKYSYSTNDLTNIDCLKCIKQLSKR